MPHAPWCQRHADPGAVQRMRFGALAYAEIQLRRPCEACQRYNPSWPWMKAEKG